MQNLIKTQGTRSMLNQFSDSQQGQGFTLLKKTRQNLKHFGGGITSRVFTQAVGSGDVIDL